MSGNIWVATMIHGWYIFWQQSQAFCIKLSFLYQRKNAQKQVVVKPIRKTIGEPVREICFISEVLEIRHVIVQIKIPALYRF